MIVFIARYADMFFYFWGIYNFVMKLAFLGLTALLIFFMRFKSPYNQTYDSAADDFNYLVYLVPPSAILGLVFCFDYDLWEILWTFSIFLESFSILPQLTLLQKMKEVENLTSHYVFCLGAYRLLYILNWIYRWVEEGSFVWVSALAALVQTALYADFFYYYIQAMRTGSNVVIPV